MNKQQYKEFGKQGSDKRWGKDREKTRHETLVELSKHIDKDFQNFLMNSRKWSLENLIKLLNYIKKNGKFN